MLDSPAPRRVALFLAAALCLPADRFAFAQSDQISTSGGGGGNIVADARAWWANPTGHSDEFRTRTRHCLDLLDEAEAHRRTAMDYKVRAKAKGPMSSRERTRLNRLGNEEYAIVTRLVRKFYECARVSADRIDTGGGRRPPPQRPTYGGGAEDAPPPGRRPPPRGDRIETGGEDPRAGRTPHMPVPGGDPASPGMQRICNLQRLAQWVFMRYNTGHPIARVQVTNTSEPTYLLLLSGVEFERPAQANTWGQAFLAWANIQPLDAYRTAIVRAVAGLPPHATLIIVGHSQGGLEAQTVASLLVRAHGFRVPMVIGFGAPIMPDRLDGTAYLHVRSPDDPVPALDRRYALGHEVLLSARDTPDPHLWYPRDESGLSQFRVPGVSILRTPCYEVDVTTIQEFEAPNLFTRFFGPVNPQRPRGRLNPESGLHGDEDDYNCFWVSLAQDREWATGLPVPARCEARPIDGGDIPAILRQWYGGHPVDDLHGGRVGAGRARHAAGEKVRSSPSRIAAALGEGDPAADGRRGLVFVRPPPRRGPDGRVTVPAGHVFNVRNVRGRIDYWDEQRGFDPAPFFFVPGAAVHFYRTY
jgi:hypothetical protein